MKRASIAVNVTKNPDGSLTVAEGNGMYARITMSLVDCAIVYFKKDITGKEQRLYVVSEEDPMPSGSRPIWRMRH